MRIALDAGLAAAMRRRPAPPQLLRAPFLRGAGRIGRPLVAEPGEWSGAGGFAYAWLRDGAPIAGADAPVYAPGPSDAGTRIVCRVTARGAGGAAEATTQAVPAAYPPIAALGGPLDLLASILGTGSRKLDISPLFSGGALKFSVTGAGISVDPATGAASFDSAALAAGLTFKIAADNASGRAELVLNFKTPAAPAA